MKTSNTMLLAGIFVILLLIVLAPYALQRFNVGQKKGDNLQLSQIKKDQINKVLIKSGSEKVELKKDASVWMAGKYKASESLINDFFMSLENSTESGLVSKNKENQTGYGISDTNGLSLTLYSGNQERVYILGNSGPETGSFYMRRAKDNNVYLVTGGLKDKIFASVDGWRDKTVTAFDQKQISKIEVTGNKNYSLIREKDKWKLKGETVNKDLKDEELSTILSNLSNLLADSFLTDEEIKEYKEAEEKTTISIGSDKQVLGELTVWQKEENGDYFVTVKGREDFFKVSSYKLEDLFKLGE